MQVFLFGHPGSGKNFVGEILRDNFGFFFYDGDELLTPEMKKFIKAGKDIPYEFLVDLIQRQDVKFNELKAIHPKLALAQPLPQRPAHERMLTLFPDAIFIRVVAPISLITQRLVERNNFVGANQASRIIAHSEDPVIPHAILLNDEGGEKIRTQLNKILNIT